MSAALLACALWFAVLVAPAAAICTYARRRAETLLPLSACGSACLLYLFGLAFSFYPLVKWCRENEGFS